MQCLSAGPHKNLHTRWDTLHISGVPPGLCSIHGVWSNSSCIRPDSPGSLGVVRVVPIVRIVWVVQDNPSRNLTILRSCCSHTNLHQNSELCRRLQPRTMKRLFFFLTRGMKNVCETTNIRNSACQGCEVPERETQTAPAANSSRLRGLTWRLAATPHSE